VFLLDTSQTKMVVSKRIFLFSPPKKTNNMRKILRDTSTLLLALGLVLWLGKTSTDAEFVYQTPSSPTLQSETTPDQRQENLTRLRTVAQSMGTLTLQGEDFSFRDTVKVHSGDKSLLMMEVWLKPDSFTFVYDVTCSFELIADMSKSVVYLDINPSETDLLLELPRFQSPVTIQSIVTQKQGFWSAQNWYTTSNEIVDLDNQARKKLRASIQDSGEELIPQRNLSNAWISLRKRATDETRTEMFPLGVTIY
jgi:hypothetical protein